MSDTERYHQAAALMCIGKIDKDVASSINVTPQTICNWKKKLEFQRILNEHKEEMNRDTRTRLRGLANKSAQKLEELLDATDPRIQLKAISISFHAQGYYRSMEEGLYIQIADLKNIDMDFSLE